MLLGIQFENPNKINVNDPTCDEFYNQFRAIAKKNTIIFEHVFSTIPTDRVRTFQDVNTYTSAAKLKDLDPIRVNI